MPRFQWRAKKGPVLTTGRWAHFSAASLLMMVLVLLKVNSNALAVVALGIPVVAWLLEQFTVVIYPNASHPFGDWIDFAAYLIGLGCTLIFLVQIGVLR